MSVAAGHFPGRTEGAVEGFVGNQHLTFHSQHLRASVLVYIACVEHYVDVTVAAAGGLDENAEELHDGSSRFAAARAGSRARQVEKRMDMEMKTPIFLLFGNHNLLEQGSLESDSNSTCKCFSGPWGWVQSL